MTNIKCSNSNDLNIQTCLQDQDEILKMEPRQNQLIFEGDPIDLKCRLTKNYTNYTINWYLNNTLLTNLPSNHIKIKQNSTYSELNINSLNSRQHTGTWKCAFQVNGNYKLKTEIFIQVLTTSTLNDDTKLIFCPDTVTITSKGVYKWNKTNEINRTIEQECLLNPEKYTTYDCRLQNDNKTANWYNLNATECDFESNLTRYLNSLLKTTSNISLNFTLNMTKSTTIDFQLIIRLIQSRFSKNKDQTGKFLIQFFNFLSNQTLEIDNFADFSPFEFNLSLSTLFQMLNYHLYTFNSIQNTQVLLINTPITIYKQSNLLAYYLNSFNICSSVISIDLPAPSNLTLQFDINTQHLSSPDNELTSLVSKLNWKNMKFFNYKDRYKDSLQNYDLLYSSNSLTLQNWLPYNHTNTNFTCTLDSLSENQAILSTKCNFPSKTRINLAIKPSNSTQTDLKFFYHNEKFIYFSSALSATLLLINIFAYLINHSRILMPTNFKHCLINIWINQLAQIICNLLLLIQINIKPICIINSLLEHIFILSSFLWYLILVYELYKKLVKLYNGNITPSVDDDDDDLDDDEDGLKKKHKPIVHLYMIALALPVFLCLISYTSTPKYINFDYLNYCFITQVDILLVTFMLPIVVILVVTAVFSILILRVYNMILKSLEVEEDVKSINIDGNTKFSSSNDSSVMDTQYRPKVQLMFIGICLAVYILMQISLQIQIFKRYLFSFKYFSQIESLFSYIYSLFLLVYSIINFSFYFLTRTDTFPKRDWFSKKKNYYFEQQKQVADVDSSPGKVTPVDESQSDGKSIESEAVVEANLCLLNELIEKEVCVTPTSINYIDATNGGGTASCNSFSDQQKRKTHVRNGSILSGQFNFEQQMMINSLIVQNTTTTPSPGNTNSMTKRAAPIYVFVDHTYEEKVIKKIKSPVCELKQETSGVWLNRFCESDKPFKNETSV